MILLPLNLYCFNKNTIENFEYEQNEFRQQQASNNLVCINKYLIYFITFFISCYAGYLAYYCNNSNPTVLFNTNMPNWVLGIWGFFLGWIYLLWFYFSHHVFKFTSCDPYN